MLRRDVLKSLAALAALPAAAWAEEPGLQLAAEASAFDQDTVLARARALATKPYSPRPQIPESWRNLTYDQYRKIWFDARNALWENSDAPQRVDVFPPGLYFPQAVALHVVEEGQSRPVRFDMGVFDTTDKFPDVDLDETLGYSGLRLRAELETSGIFQEYAVFQGASYFRGIGTGEIYGLSARGLALKTGDPMGEEFPDFTAFWLETPAPGSDSIVLHALLDSPSCTGAYRFEITHGAVLEMQVEAHVFARTDITHLGIAPLTSMFLFDDTMRQRFSDFRPAVHDSDGLLIHNGAGEVIWRPLANPAALQISAFADNNPRGFGLMQRKRKFSDFNDLEALYHKRPAVWITPGEDWGKGAVTLVEIPADLEIYDNIVAYWRPSAPLKAGSQHQMSYTLHWGADPVVDVPDMPLKVLNTAMGGRPEGGQIIAIDFEDAAHVPDDLSKVEIILRSSAGDTSSGIVQRNPEIGGPRLAFTFEPGEATLAEFRAQLRLNGAPLSEVWLYRWTAS
ncbi:glucan biosynthesis protein G [Sulfitobacter mediterraneus]|uniref:glucan biosynthesis protein n=1 Tax=Sulfitobacter mediterraneus TaxID=83219 RepID=UPI0019311D2D|nr:glucan biosynthesis protein G [Sulfitobacter mediterraneus]MBM1633844.1 glucan biosynthesis protein G [Sulfitobacter mediterraneus]MBM1641641.1 glucan biosynthesis protein G [Sulfitobacter mediterraneus]MBM1645708.1 glucan biosynthesis protein G [Sulfitobacter mediterraneus]MBM1649760.1 glucan biosynthesis protein G [Sulfitobacter mediterraneus]MBM1653777.1 glucan biosynthesis protein G [Sulfitobacter mediterraneus]